MVTSATAPGSRTIWLTALAFAAEAPVLDRFRPGPEAAAATLDGLESAAFGSFDAGLWYEAQNAPWVEADSVPIAERRVATLAVAVHGPMGVLVEGALPMVVGRTGFDAAGPLGGGTVGSMALRARMAHVFPSGVRGGAALRASTASPETGEQTGRVGPELSLAWSSRAVGLAASAAWMAGLLDIRAGGDLRVLDGVALFVEGQGLGVSGEPLGIEARVGARAFLGGGVAVESGVGMPVVSDDGVPSSRIWAGVRLAPRKPAAEVLPPLTEAAPESEPAPEPEPEAEGGWPPAEPVAVPPPEEPEEVPPPVWPPPEPPPSVPPPPEPAPARPPAEPAAAASPPSEPPSAWPPAEPVPAAPPPAGPPPAWPPPEPVAVPAPEAPVSSGHSPWTTAPAEAEPVSAGAVELSYARPLVLHPAFEGSALTAEGRAALQPLIDRLRASPLLAVRIEAHLKAGGSDDEFAITQARADAVRAALTTAGIAGSRVEAIGFGSGIHGDDRLVVVLVR